MRRAVRHSRNNTPRGVGEGRNVLGSALMREFGKTLTGKDRTIFEERLLTEEPKTLQEIGEIYGISRERVRQIEERLKRRLRDFLVADAKDVQASK